MEETLEGGRGPPRAAVGVRDSVDVKLFTALHLVP